MLELAERAGARNIRVEVAEHRPAHRVQHGGVNVGRAGSAQEALGRPELGEVHMPQGAAAAL